MKFYASISILLLALMLLIFVCVRKCKGEDMTMSVSTPREYVALLNWFAEENHAHCRFRCLNYEADVPILEVHTSYSTKGLKKYKEGTITGMNELAIDWYHLTKSTTIYVFDVGREFKDLEDDNLVYIYKEGDVIEPGTLM